MTATVEAIQARLHGHGIILYPGTPKQPPPVIPIESIYHGDFHTFSEANELGPVFDYDYNAMKGQWELRP
jgi:hypothetical protein